MPVVAKPYGHIGLFPEQAPHWHWLSDVDAAANPTALNLFGYTGASTIAMMSAGLHVTHIDAAKPNVAAARSAAEANGLANTPARFMVDDANKFAAREVRRQRSYQTIVLDPPAYGHDPSGRAWRLQRDLWHLLDDVIRLIEPLGRILVTGHTDGIDGQTVADYILLHGPKLNPAAGWKDAKIETGRNSIPALNGRELDAGFYCRIVINQVA